MLYSFPNFPGGGWEVQYASDLYVDLGLPSGLKWATCNVGAVRPEIYGNHIAWGETIGVIEGKTSFDWSTYAWGNAENALTKYCSKSEYGKDGFTDALTTLEKEDDAAYAALGGKFRMPTHGEWEELFYNTTSTWTQQGGINGRLFSATNGKSLFLPAAGQRSTRGHEYAGFAGFYSSSSFNTKYEPKSARNLQLNIGTAMGGSYERYRGFSIRPVSD